MILLIIVSITLILYYLWQRRNLLWLAHKLKGYRGYPIIGSAYLFMSANSEFLLLKWFQYMFEVALLRMIQFHLQKSLM